VYGVSAGATDSGTLIDSGTVTVSAGATLWLASATIGKSGMLETASGATAILSGTVSNSGTLYASGGNGTVEIGGASSETASFTAKGSGTLELNNAGAYTGKISGFGSGTSAHTDSSEAIDLAAVTYSAGVMGSSYSGTTTSGVLKITSGGATVASLTFIGKYTSANFHLAAGAGGSGTVITDPPASVGANVGLLGGYIAGSFVTAAGGWGGAILREEPPAQQALLTPHGS
jgi:hypothetical protein